MYFYGLYNAFIISTFEHIGNARIKLQGELPGHEACHPECGRLYHAIYLILYARLQDSRRPSVNKHLSKGHRGHMPGPTCSL